ncbi:uncharacterized protein LOC132367109 [Balaenoptera ricei]|uniref:uncharacterized protein LOC132367109 n=1 Tax=Balaenoptera ricei TaxID=2746895 RepID=UPI0028BF53A1|nr:uncharacterized protein LOC132367109 [Balaenoptera ricei]
MVRATAAPEARPNLAVAAEVRLAVPWPRTMSAAQRGAAAKGAGARGASDSQERRGDLSPSSLRNRQRLRTQHPRPRAPPRCRLSPPPVPRAGRNPPDGRTVCSEPAPLERCHTWRSQVYSTENAPEALGEETARESEQPFGGEVRLELRRAANPTVLFRCLVLPLQPRTPTFKRVTAGRLERSSRASLGVSLNPLAGLGLLAHVPACGVWDTPSLLGCVPSYDKRELQFHFPARKQLSDFLQTLQSQQPAFQSKVSWLMSLTLAQPIRRAFRRPALHTCKREEL